MTRFGYVIATVVTAQAFIVLFVTVALAPSLCISAHAKAWLQAVVKFRRT